jgi:hypothetical protein
MSRYGCWRRGFLTDPRGWELGYAADRRSGESRGGGGTWRDWRRRQQTLLRILCFWRSLRVQEDWCRFLGTRLVDH